MLSSIFEIAFSLRELRIKLNVIVREVFCSDSNWEREWSESCKDMSGL